MSINVSELIWTILCFFVLLFVLKKLLIDPLLKVMDARNANVAEGLEAGRQAQLAREENDEALQQAKKDAAQQANVLVQEAKSADEKARQAAAQTAKQTEKAAQGELSVICLSEGLDEAFAAEVEALIRERADAKKKKDFAEADKIRAHLSEMGVTLKDGKGSVSWEKA